MRITLYKETLVPHLVATLIYLSQIYSYYIRGDRSALKLKTRYVTTELDQFVFDGQSVNPLIAGPGYIWVVIILLAHLISPFNHVKDRM